MIVGMSDRQASVDLRFLAPFATAGVDPASGDDLANYDTSMLPNHAQAWGGDVLYQLDKSMSSPGVGEIQPNSGPGIWVPMPTSTTPPTPTPLQGFVIHEPALGSGTMPAAATRPLPNLAYEFVGAASIAPFTKDDNGCVLTYTGTTAKWFNIRATLAFIATADPQGMGCHFRLNGSSLDGGCTIGFVEAQVLNVTVFKALAQLETMVLLAAGDELDIVCTSSQLPSEDFDLTQFAWVVQELTNPTS